MTDLAWLDRTPRWFAVLGDYGPPPPWPLRAAATRHPRAGPPVGPAVAARPLARGRRSPPARRGPSSWRWSASTGPPPGSSPRPPAGSGRWPTSTGWRRRSPAAPTWSPPWRRVRVQGTVTGVRRVFHAKVEGAAVAADRADLLAGLLGTGLDERRLALHLLQPHILYPLAGQPVWRDIELLATDHYLVLDDEGGRRSVRSWTPPEPVVPWPRVRRRCGRRWRPPSTPGSGAASWSAATSAGSTRPRCAAWPPAGRPRWSPTRRRPGTRWPTTSPGPAGRWPPWARSSTTSSPPRRCRWCSRASGGVNDRLDEPCSATADRERWFAIARRAAARGPGCT